MQLRSNSFKDGDFIPTPYALGKTSAEGKIDLSDNKSPHLAWSDLPEGTQSVAILYRAVTSVKTLGTVVDQM